LDRFIHMFNLQKQFDQRVQAENALWRVTGEREKLFKLTQAMKGEMNELEESLGYLPNGVQKWWKDSFNKKHTLEESIDIFHFLLSFWNNLGVTSTEVFQEYKRKMEINHERQNKGY